MSVAGVRRGPLDREGLRARLWVARTLPPAALAAALPGVRFEAFEATGHSPYFERAEAFNARLGAFLRTTG